MTIADEMFSLANIIVTSMENGEAARDPVLHESRLRRLRELSDQSWAEMTTHMTELQPYQSLTEGIHVMAQRLGIPVPEGAYKVRLPEIRRRSYYQRVRDRAIQILPSWSDRVTPQYSVDLFDKPESYQGDTSSLEEITSVISAWLVQYVPIHELVNRHPWLSAMTTHRKEQSQTKDSDE